MKRYALLLFVVVGCGGGQPVQPVKDKNVGVPVAGIAGDEKRVIREYLTLQKKAEPKFTLWEHHDLKVQALGYSSKLVRAKYRLPAQKADEQDHDEIFEMKSGKLAFGNTGRNFKGDRWREQYEQMEKAADWLQKNVAP